MSYLDKIKNRLLEGNRKAIDTLQPNNLDEIKKINEELKKRLNQIEVGEFISQDRTIKALRNFYFERDLTISELRAICYSLGFPFTLDENETKKHILIEKEDLTIDDVLIKTKSYSNNIKVFRKLYKGIFSSYFHQDRTGLTLINLYKLRQFLIQNINSIYDDSDSFNPEWVKTLHENKNLLTDNPYEIYGLSILHGDNTSKNLFESACNELGIQSSSWLVKEFITYQIEEAIKFNDNKFKPLISILLKILSENKLYLDKLLGLILNRYQQCADNSLNKELCYFSIEYWKNPWLDINTVRWRNVNETTKKMVVNWLKIDGIKQFFSLLSEDGNNDLRRVSFWEKYHENISDMYFVLSTTTLNNKSIDLKNIRKSMEGRLLTLKHDSNAFIMIFGKYYIVEFGSTKNATYIYSKEKNLPFDLDLKNNIFNIFDFKNRTHNSFRNRLLHSSNWEISFEEELEKIGVLKNQKISHKKS